MSTKALEGKPLDERLQLNPLLHIDRVAPHLSDGIGHCRVQCIHGGTRFTATCLVPDGAPQPEAGQVFLVKNTHRSGRLSAELWVNGRTDRVRYVLTILPSRPS